MIRQGSEARGTVLGRLDALIEEYVDPEQAPRLRAFAHALHASTPTEDLESSNPEDVYAAIVSAEQLLRHEDAAAARVRVFNPSIDLDGWSSVHSVAQIHHPDAPFIVDSFLMALARQELTLHCMHNAVLRVKRDEAGRYLGLADAADDDACLEVVLHAEIDRLDPDAFDAFESELTETLADVRAVVGDFQPMRERVEALASELDALRDHLPADEVDEAQAFLHWLLDDNFTFLGCREFSIDDEADGRVVRQLPGSALGLLSRRSRPSRERRLEDMREATRGFIVEKRALQFSKGGTRSRVHRPAYPDYVAIKRLDGNGRVVGEAGVLGLYTSNVYTDSPFDIPVLRRRAKDVVARSGFKPGGFDAKVLGQVLATFPRDELFQSTDAELTDTALQITNNHERNRLKVFVREDRYGMFFSCQVFTPREIYATTLREGIQQILVDELQAIDAEFTSYFSESVLIRTHFVLRVDPEREFEWDAARIERRIQRLARNWEDDLRDALVARHGEADARALARRYRNAFSAGYRERFDGRMAVYDLEHLEALADATPLSMRLYRHPEDAPTRLRLKVFHRGDGVALSELMPLLENLGVKVLQQRPYGVRPAGGVDHWIYDFTLEHALALDLARVGPRFEEAFMRTWRAETVNDRFNRLVLAAGLDWREVTVLRAYARWMKQIRFALGPVFVADTLLRQAALTRQLVAYFHLRHDPEHADADVDSARADLLAALDAIPSLDEDRVLRFYLDLVDATLRTNFYRRDANGLPLSRFAFKLASGRLPGVPKPALAFEIFVHAADVEGVHLRSGPIARGGLRWSDRQEDYRTEILGLVKAQQVKNSVIVPEGAKGGFVITAGLDGADREQRARRGVEGYRTFIRGLLDVTDNRQDGAVMPPPGVRRHDGDDPYLVVAADKGTATFSDIANEIAAEYGFWIGDAFASGGSVGYDHKKMGITARGAWTSVARHFAELGVDVQRDRFTVLGIGDMSGDVFGNGMLCSQTIELVAAFNHLHIFIDPDPDPALGAAERARLFALPRSGWDDYDPEKISDGGGVFPRSAKAIVISPRMRERFGIEAERLTPDELIQALLQAPVDLIWNGGIGTYVKAADESHADVGDRANDALRVDGGALRARVFGEGGNLGLTQRGRIEAARRGVALNTDFIDNSGGVDCSDHEVNIKLLLGEVVAAGDLTSKQRNALLEAMTDDVSELVLAGNRRQAQALALVDVHARGRLGEYQRFIAQMETHQGLDRALEQLPGDDELADRIRAGGALTRPELAVLLAYAKAHVKRSLITTSLVREDCAAAFARAEFPDTFVERFRDRIARHYVHDHIVATRLAGDLVDHMGVTFVVHLKEYIGADVEDIARAWLVVREVFSIASLFERIEALPTSVPTAERDRALLEFMRLGRRASRWFLRHRQDVLDPAQLIEQFREPVSALLAMWVETSRSSATDASADTAGTGLGGDGDLAVLSTAAGSQVASLAIVDTALAAGRPVEAVGPLYMRLAARLRVDRLSDALGALEPQTLWQAMERDALLDELVTQTGALCLRILTDAEDTVEDGAGLDAWLAVRQSRLELWDGVRSDALRDEVPDFAVYSMAVRRYGDLVRAL